MGLSNLKEKFENWAGNSPVVAVPLAAGMMTYAAVMTLASVVRTQFNYTTKSLEGFDPKNPLDTADAVEEAAWHGRILGEGRAEALLARLKGIPFTGDKIQKFCLSRSEGGMARLPQHKDLVKFGLNDRLLSDAISGLDWFIGHAAQEDGVAGSLTAEGLKNPETGAVMGDRNTVISAVQAGLYSHVSYEGADPAIPQKIANAVYDWVIHEVQPAVPELFTQSIPPRTSPVTGAPSPA